MIKDISSSFPSLSSLLPIMKYVMEVNIQKGSILIGIITLKNKETL